MTEMNHGPARVTKNGADMLLRSISRSRFLPFSFRLKLVEFLRPTGCKVSFKQSVHGVDYHGVPENLIDSHVYYFGIYEPSTLACMQFCVSRIPGLSNKTFLDIGANTGLFTLLGSRIFTSVFSFEPYPPVFSRLQMHVFLNGFDNVKLFPFGLGASEDELPFKPPQNDNFGVGSFVKTEKRDEDLILRVRTGDALLREQPTTIGLIKLDVEGFEPHVLSGLRETLCRDRPVIIMELNRDTKAAFGNLDRFMARLPPDYVIRTIKRKTEKCNLIRFDWNHKQDNILAIPSSLACALE